MSPKNVKIKEAVHLFFRNYAKFDGRSTRSEFWWVFLVGVIILSVFGMLASIFPLILTVLLPLVIILYIIFSLAVLVPSIAIMIRRLHDTGKSGYYILLCLTPVTILIVLYFLAQPGDPRPNQYGEPADFGQPY